MSDEPEKVRVLLVEDDPSIQLALSDRLGFDGFAVDCERDGLAAWRRLEKSPDAYGIVLLDVMLPSLDGLEVCRRMRERGISTPVLMLTARGLESDRVVGLEIGADDYVVKPFSARELVARIGAILRRQQIERTRDRTPESASRVVIGSRSVDLAAFRVLEGERTIADLSPTERRVLELLAQHRGQVVSRARLLDVVWGLDDVPTTRTVDFHLRQLRKKIEPDPAAPRYLTTVHGVGYRLELEP